MLDKKTIERKIREHYLEIFMNKSIDDYKVKNFGQFDDWRNIKYYCDEFIHEDKKIIFHIKNSHLRLRLVVLIEYTKKRNDISAENIILYHDLFHLKKKDPIKKKLLNIVAMVKYNELLTSVKGDVVFMRKLKLEELKRKM